MRALHPALHPCQGVTGALRAPFPLIIAAVSIEISAHFALGPEPGNLRGVDHDCNDIPDAAMTLAVAALFADGPTAIRNVYNWRVKETERMVAIVTELRKLGAQVLSLQGFWRQCCCEVRLQWVGNGVTTERPGACPG